MRTRTPHRSCTRFVPTGAASRPGACLHRSRPSRTSSGRRLARRGTRAGGLVAAAAGLGAALAGAAYGAPHPVTAARSSARSPVDGSAQAPLSGLGRRPDLARSDVSRPEAASRGHRRAALVAPPAATAPAAAPAAASTGTPVGPSFAGIASWYGPGFQGRPTASGTPYDENALTAASRTLPLGTHLRVCRAGVCVRVLVNDWGPVPRSRVLDLSRAAAGRLGYLSAGLAEIMATPVR